MHMAMQGALQAMAEHAQKQFWRLTMQKQVSSKSCGQVMICLGGEADSELVGMLLETAA